MRLRQVRVLLITVCLLAFPCRAPAPLVYRQGEGWVHEPAVGSADLPREVVLRPEVAPYELERVYRNLARTKKPFLKEPELSQQGVFRGVLQLDKKDTNNAIALIWDQPKAKLYLDLNRNLDLTDDSAGAFNAASKGPQQLFTNITLLLTTTAGRSPAVLDLRLSSDGEGRQIQAQLSLRSLWQAQIGPPGQEWQVAVADDLFSPEGPAATKFLVLRPWAARTNSLSLRDGTSGVIRFPEQLFWLGQAFHLERGFETREGVTVCKLEFTPQQPLLTEVKLSGESLYYAVLRATNGYTVVLREPQGPIKLPQGVYTVKGLWLKKGPAEAYRLANEPLLINATASTNIVLGGPLTNQVTLTRQGGKLRMIYQLVGVDGGSYLMAQQDRAKPPEFTVYHGGKKIQSGKFEFG